MSILMSGYLLVLMATTAFPNMKRLMNTPCALCLSCCAYPGLSGRPLCVAAEKGHLDVVRLLVQYGVDINNSSAEITPWGTAPAGRNTYNPLAAAASAGQLEVARLLLDHGADPTLGDSLYEAAHAGHADMVQLLLQRGAGACEGAQHSPQQTLQVACDEGHARVVDVLLEAGYGEPSQYLVPAVAAGYTDVVEVLAQRGADVNLRGGCPLRVAAGNGFNLIARLLLQAGAEVSEEVGRELLDLAHKRSDGVLLQLLTDRALAAAAARAGPTDSCGYSSMTGGFKLLWWSSVICLLKVKHATFSTCCLWW
jgi:ankyrin repeat protein